jgi:hypothetical protein
MYYFIDEKLKFILFLTFIMNIGQKKPHLSKKDMK